MEVDLHKGLRKRGLAIAAPLLLALTVMTQAAQAKIWHVNSTADGPGCSVATCTLRGAIGAAANGDEVDVPSGHYKLTKGRINVAPSISIVGAGAAKVAIDGANKFEVFIIPAGSAVTIDGVTVTNGSWNLPGGAIHVDGTLNMRDSTISNSRANAHGGGLYSDGTLNLSQSTISGNRGSAGGGVYNDAGGAVTVQGTTVTGNTAGSGAGIYENSGRADSITNSTITGNTATAQGGGIFDNNNAGGLTGVNLTIVGNGARDGSNVYFNRVTAGGLENTIVASPGGFAHNCDNGGSQPASAGHNLEDDPAGVGGAGRCGFGPGTNDLVGSSPKLGPLAGNGGPTQTMALKAGSPAIDAGAAVASVTTDQRGGARPQPAAGAFDIGAYERSALVDLTLSALGSPQPATVGHALLYKFTVANAGPTSDQAFGVEVSAPIPAGVKLVAATASQGSCKQVSGTLACQLGTLAQGGRATVKLSVTPQSPGKTAGSAVAAGSAADPNLANNKASAQVQVQDKPAAQTNHAKGVLFKRATLKGHVNPNNASTTYLFQYGRTTGYGSSTSSKAAGSGLAALPVSLAVKGLRPGTLYHYRLVAKNARGQTMGHDRTFRTPQYPSVHVSPAHVTAGEKVHVYGNAGLCPAGRTLTLLSSAFPSTHTYKGLGAVYTTVQSGGGFSVFVQIPSSRKGGPYAVSGLCGRFP